MSAVMLRTRLESKKLFNDIVGLADVVVLEVVKNEAVVLGVVLVVAVVVLGVVVLVVVEVLLRLVEIALHILDIVVLGVNLDMVVGKVVVVVVDVVVGVILHWFPVKFLTGVGDGNAPINQISI